MFILINGFNLIVLLLRMRPVALGPLEERLHLMVFNIMTPRELLELIEIGSWRSKPAGDNIIRQGERVDGVCLLAEGDTAVIVDGDQKAQLGEGDFFGEMSFITGGAATADVCATSEVTYLYWERSKLNAFYDKHPRIKDVMQAVLGRNMAEKLKRTHQK
jgi:CRP-like cAMP-binding protein